MYTFLPTWRKFRVSPYKIKSQIVGWEVPDLENCFSWNFDKKIRALRNFGQASSSTFYALSAKIHSCGYPFLDFSCNLFRKTLGKLNFQAEEHVFFYFWDRCCLEIRTKNCRWMAPGRENDFLQTFDKIIVDHQKFWTGSPDRHFTSYFLKKRFSDYLFWISTVICPEKS